MFVLLLIVIFAVVALWLSNSERKHPAALVMLGLMSIALGGRGVALLSDSFSDEYLGTVYADEENPATELSPSALPPSDGNAVLGEVSSDAEMSETATSDDTATRDLSSTEPLEVTTETDLDRLALIGNAPHELAIEPKPTFIYLTTPRPDWVETEALKADDGYQIAVESGMHVRKRTAQQALRDEVKATVDAYVNDYLESSLASKLAGYSIEERESGTARTIHLCLDGESFEIARERFEEQIEFDYGVMNQSHALVKIDKKVKKALDEHWSKVRAASRLFQAGLGVGAVLLLLGTMFSYLKLDTATRGYYTGRLQFGAAAAILAIVAAGVVCANWIPWM